MAEVKVMWHADVLFAILAFFLSFLSSWSWLNKSSYYGVCEIYGSVYLFAKQPQQQTDCRTKRGKKTEDLNLPSHRFWPEATTSCTGSCQWSEPRKHWLPPPLLPTCVRVFLSLSFLSWRHTLAHSLSRSCDYTEKFHYKWCSCSASLRELYLISNSFSFLTDSYKTDGKEA